MARAARPVVRAVAVAIAAAMALVNGIAAYAEPVTYRLLPEYSFVQFEVMHFGTSTTRGRFGPLRGEVTLDREAGKGEVTLSIPTAAVDTGMGFFNARLREADLLANAQHPEAYFVARRFVFEGPRLQSVRGEFTLRGISQGLTLKATRFGCRRDELPGEICGGDFEGEFLRSEHGITFGLPLIGDRVRLLVQVEGRR